MPWINERIFEYEELQSLAERHIYEVSNDNNKIDEKDYYMEVQVFVGIALGHLKELRYKLIT